MTTTHPPFVLCGPAGTLVADDVQTRYCTVTGARAALRSGAVPIVLGALPFDVEAPAALMTPRAVRRTDTLPDWPSGPMPAVRIAAALPPPDEHRTRVAAARDQLTAPGATLRKV
ncbi:MAG: isochorismate synthase, partial [Mycobacterium sp.]